MGIAQWVGWPLAMHNIRDHLHVIFLVTFSLMQDVDTKKSENRKKLSNFICVVFLKNESKTESSSYISLTSSHGECGILMPNGKRAEARKA